MADAHQSGTDNEGYSALAREFDGETFIGYDLPNVKFCPWCGDEKGLDHE